MHSPRVSGSAATPFSRRITRGLTNEEGFHVVWQFSDSVSGPWNMAVLQDDTWQNFKMDLGYPDHRAAFLNGETPADLSVIRVPNRPS